MDFKKKMKKFFTMTRKADGGFTLVELIVVIAILAILGGVAVPAYSGYVRKAEAAADQQLLAAVNTAFVSACLTNGESNTGRSDVVALGVDSNGKVISVGSNQKINNTFFQTYFAGNEDAAFKVNKEYVYGSEIGMFRLPEFFQVTYSHNGKMHTLTISEMDKELFLNSTLGDLGVDYLLGEMDNVVTYASDYERLLTNVKDEKEFQEICKMFDGYGTGDTDKDKAIEMQALVLYTAGKYENLSTDYVYDTIIANPGQYIPDYEDEGRGFAVNAAMYALGLTYANSKEGLEIVNDNGWDVKNLTVDQVRKLMTNIDAEKDEFGGPVAGTEYNTFGKWLQDNVEEAKTNLDAFGGTMGMLTDNKGNLNTDMLLNSGYGNAGLVDGLAGFLGGK